MVVVPLHSGSRNLNLLLNSDADTMVGDNDVASFGEGRDDGRDGREALRIKNGTFGA